MKVQFNPIEYQSMLTIASSQEEMENQSDSDGSADQSEEESDDDDPLHTSRLRHSIRANPNLAPGLAPNPSDRSGSPTPRNSPRESGRHQRNDPLRNSAHSTLTRHQISVLTRSSQATPLYEPRLVFPALKKSGDLGVRLMGGNAVGIFIHSVNPDSAAYAVGLRCADQILEYNGVDLRNATAEQAAYELAKPAEKVTILVQYNPESKLIEEILLQDVKH